MRYQLLGLITMLGLVACSATAATNAMGANGGDPFTYKLQMTPEEGPLDPAIEQRHTAQLAACQKRAVATYESAACFEAEFVRQDAVLSRVWKAAFHRVPPVQREALLNAQRKWIAERDPFCETVADGFSGGTIEPIVYTDCRVEQTIRRAIWLEKLR
jgi:uncharacterized protein YecT (DUF1311 family)